MIRKPRQASSVEDGVGAVGSIYIYDVGNRYRTDRGKPKTYLLCLSSLKDFIQQGRRLSYSGKPIGTEVGPKLGVAFDSPTTAAIKRCYPAK